MMNYPHYGGPGRRFFFIPFIILLFFVLSGVVMLLWNLVLPDVLHTGHITYWQSAGLLLLSRILFGHFHFGGRGGGPQRHFKEKWAGMSEDERTRFREQFRQRHGHHPGH